jgi:hypothetical protein
MLMVSLAAPQAAARQCRWWLEPGVPRALLLTPSQVVAITAEYSRTLKYRGRLRQEFDVAHSALTCAIEGGHGSDKAIEAMVNAYTKLRPNDRRVRRVPAAGNWMVGPPSSWSSGDQEGGVGGLG